MDSGFLSAASGAEQPAISSSPTPPAETSSVPAKVQEAEAGLPLDPSSTPVEASPTAPEAQVVVTSPCAEVTVKTEPFEDQAFDSLPVDSAASGAVSEGVSEPEPLAPASDGLDFPEEIEPAQEDNQHFEHQAFDSHDRATESKPTAVRNAFGVLAEESSSEESVPSVRVFGLDQEDKPIEVSDPAQGSGEVPTSVASAPAASGADKGKGKSRSGRRATDQPGHHSGTRAGKKHSLGSTKKHYSDLQSVTASWFAAETYRLLKNAYHLSHIHFDHAYREYPDYLNWILSNPSQHFAQDHLHIDADTIRYVASIRPEFYGWLWTRGFGEQYLRGFNAPSYHSPQGQGNPPKAGELRGVRPGRPASHTASSSHQQAQRAASNPGRFAPKQGPPQKGKGWQPSLRSLEYQPNQPAADSRQQRLRPQSLDQGRLPPTPPLPPRKVQWTNSPKEPLYPPTGWTNQQLQVTSKSKNPQPPARDAQGKDQESQDTTGKGEGHRPPPKNSPIAPIPVTPCPQGCRSIGKYCP